MDPYIVIKAFAPADPVSIKEALVASINLVIEQAGDNIIDWGTTSIQSQYVMNPEEGQELIYFITTVRAMDVSSGI